MPSELICPDHGHFDASYITCPYCTCKSKQQLTSGQIYDDLIDDTEIFLKFMLKAILMVKKGHQPGHEFTIFDGSIVGRTEGDVILDDPKVSNPHAKFYLNEEGDSFVILDFGSKTGTYVNEEHITSLVELEENDVIKIGDSEMILKIFD